MGLVLVLAMSGRHKEGPKAARERTRPPVDARKDEAYLTSAKLSGRSHSSAPPKRRAVTNPWGMVISGSCCDATVERWCAQEPGRGRGRGRESGRCRARAGMRRSSWCRKLEPVCDSDIRRPQQGMAGSCRRRVAGYHARLRWLWPLLVPATPADHVPQTAQPARTRDPGLMVVQHVAGQ